MDNYNKLFMIIRKTDLLNFDEKQELQLYLMNLQEQVKKQKEVIDRIKEYIEPLVTNKDDEECYPINFYVKDVLLSILKEVSE